ncbi:hypothetical protein EV651_13216 [Kribbella sp. VKM Ac-2571]|uniref:hypothetical protein n=1 Tax=Kribbella sp. VKM Ac-2571 TaxID=2512222 RepID=UPI0010604B75|nr:hypothetical protein [Kribbella sp. VKM Ac-2571]TDO44756.1 hypothetical protein EV651_13216 [Kribbella sp. VKM Ac-2571]
MPEPILVVLVSGLIVALPRLAIVILAFRVFERTGDPKSLREIVPLLRLGPRSCLHRRSHPPEPPDKP